MAKRVSRKALSVRQLPKMPQSEQGKEGAGNKVQKRCRIMLRGFWNDLVCLPASGKQRLRKGNESSEMRLPLLAFQK